MIQRLPSGTALRELKVLGHIMIAVLLLSPVPTDAKELHPVARATDQETESPLTYVSDYFSFTGEDDVGRVAIALDAIRGRDGDTWQAEHLVVVLHDEQQGWIDLQGAGSYDNVNKELIEIPDSPFFEFRGTPSTGITINTPTNQLVLRVEPIPERRSRKSDGSYYKMGSAAGTLEWNGRIVRGLIIHEHLFMQGFNRLTQSYTDLWTESHGLYAWMSETGDHLYLRSQEDPSRLSPLIGQLVGFGVFNEQGEDMRDLKLRVSRREQALGFYRWPIAWEGTWVDRGGRGAIVIHLSDLTVMTNFIIGGFAMGIIKGEVTYKGRTQDIYGLAELLI